MSTEKEIKMEMMLSNRIINSEDGESFCINQNDMDLILEAYSDDELIFSVQGIYVEPNAFESIKDRLGV